jgi:hypothetical protein
VNKKLSLCDGITLLISRGPFSKGEIMAVTEPIGGKEKSRETKETVTLYRSIFQGQVNGRKGKIPTRASLLGGVRMNMKKWKSHPEKLKCHCMIFHNTLSMQ